MPGKTGGIPNKDIIGTKGRKLQGRLILLGITGSPGAVESVELARELMRMGAEVVPIMSHASSQLINPTLLEWATGNPPVTELTGKIEHILYTHSTGRPADLYLIAPCTGNTIGKIASGIDDTPVTSTATAAIGEKLPIIIAPAMHDSMWSNPFVVENLRKLENAGITLVKPRLEEGKAKIADNATIVEVIISRLSKQDLHGKSALITAGPTIEYLDPVRILTNRSSGKMGIVLAKTAHRRGATVTLVLGPGSAIPPPWLNVIHVETTEEMFRAVSEELREKRHDVAILCAAPADFAPSKKSPVKVDSQTHRNLLLQMKATPKILDAVKRISPSTFVVAFKAEVNLTEGKLVERAFRRLKQADADLIAVNDVSKDGVGFGEETNEVLLVDGRRRIIKIGPASKEEVAERILDEVASRVGNANRKYRQRKQPARA